MWCSLDIIKNKPTKKWAFLLQNQKIISIFVKMNKYERLKKELEEVGTGKMKAFGTSMMPIIKSGSLLTFVKKETYEIGDIVFCKVKGSYIDF